MTSVNHSMRMVETSAIHFLNAIGAHFGRIVLKVASTFTKFAAVVTSALTISFGPTAVTASPSTIVRVGDVAAVVRIMDGTSDVQLIKDAAGSNVMIFPVAGKIVKWQIFFKYTTQCENDHRVVLTSPTGRKLMLMDRGQGRCSGKSSTFSSDNDNDASAFIGTRAKGKWIFTMVDLDKNDFTGSLEEVRMKLTIKNDGKLSEHEVSLSGLPILIAAAKQ